MSNSSSKIRLKKELNRLKPSHYGSSERNSNDLYPFSILDFDVGETEVNIQTLDLSAPATHPDSKKSKRKNEPKRPITPIKDEIKTCPRTFKKLTAYIRRRLIPIIHPDYPSEKEQQQMADIIMGEVNCVWTDLHHSVADPFLDETNNRELTRRITVHLVTVCEHLFVDYLTRMHDLNKYDTFSIEANMSRLKANLATDTSRLVDVNVIRRYVLRIIKSELALPPNEELQNTARNVGQLKWPTSVSRSEQRQWSHRMSMTSSSLDDQMYERATLSRISTSKFGFSLEDELLLLEDQMPDLDGEKLVNIVDHINYINLMSQHKTKDKEEQIVKVKTYIERRRQSSALIRDRILLKKCPSVPDIREEENLLSDIGVTRKSLKQRSSSLPRGYTSSEPSGIKEPHEKATLPTVTAQNRQNKDQSRGRTGDKRPLPNDELMARHRRHHMTTDMQSLVRSAADDKIRDDNVEDLPPLLQSIDRHRRNDSGMQQIKKKLELLKERELLKENSEKIVIRKPVHPQPTIVTQKMSDDVIIRLGDVRISERKVISELTLAPHPPKYNDLLNEIDADTVKAMDSCLFLGDEISEVYTEIMKTVTKDHLIMDNDENILEAADAVNISTALSSWTLTRKLEDRIINSALIQRCEPPWSQEGFEEWSNNPLAPPKDDKGKSLMPKTPGSVSLGPLVENLNTTPPGDIVEQMGDVMARSYNSWLTWWKTNTNSEDYIRFVSSQDNDFMSVILHTFDEEIVEDQGESSTSIRIASKHKKQIEREKLLSELWSTKTKYIPGEWNTHTVLMNGLANVPQLPDIGPKSTDGNEEVEDKLAGARCIDKSLRIRTLREKLNSKGDSNYDYLCAADLQAGSSELRSLRSQSKTYATGTTEACGGGEAAPTTPQSSQQRLQHIWTQLHTPENQKLDMAIKYSGQSNHAKLDSAIECWETICDPIIAREQLISQLERFESVASHPKRFFEKTKGSAKLRLQEAKDRSSLYKKIERLDFDIKYLWKQIYDDFGDKVTYQGRDYLDKMKWDRTEMLYWLQEERRKRVHKHHNKDRMRVSCAKTITPMIQQ